MKKTAQERMVRCNYSVKKSLRDLIPILGVGTRFFGCFQPYRGSLFFNDPRERSRAMNQESSKTSKLRNEPNFHPGHDSSKSRIFRVLCQFKAGVSGFVLENSKPLKRARGENRHIIKSRRNLGTLDSFSSPVNLIRIKAETRS